MCLEERVKNVDSLRGLAALLVVLGHVIQYSEVADSFAGFNSVFLVIYSFHMPLFALISGYLIGDKKEGTVKRIVRRCILVVPMVVYSIVPFFTEGIYVERDSIMMNLRHFIGYSVHGNGFTWFLRTILVVSILLIIICRFVSDTRWLYLLILSTLFYPYDYGISVFAYIFVFAIVGAIVKKDNLTKLLDNNVCRVCACIVFVLVLLIYKKEYLIYNGRWGILGDSNWRQIVFEDFLRIIAGISGCMCARYLVMCLDRWMRLLGKTWGRNSLGAYCIGHLVCVYSSRIINFDNALYEFIALNVITFCVTYVSIKALNMNKYTRILFLGRW